MTRDPLNPYAETVITFPVEEPETAVPGLSLLITTARRYSDQSAVTPSGDDSNVIGPVYTHARWLTIRRWQLDSEEFSTLVRETNLGQESLFRYLREYRRADLKIAVQHLECVLEPSMSSRYHAVVLANLARAKFISHKIDPTSANLDDVIQFYGQALRLRLPGHLDRPATLLQLAQTLLFRYEEQGSSKSVADEIKTLMAELQGFPADSHELRALELVRISLKRCEVTKSGSLAELNELVWELEHDAEVPPDNYFDRPQRMMNLGIALRGRYEKNGQITDLDKSLEITKRALHLLPARHPDKLFGVRTLGAVLWTLCEIRGDLSYLRNLIDLSEEVLELLPEGHSARSYWEPLVALSSTTDL